MENDNADIFERAVMISDMCGDHQRRLVQGLSIPENGPWRVALILAGIMLFQATTADDAFWQRATPHEGGKPTTKDMSLVLAEMGCLACRKPKAFEQIYTIMRKQGLTTAAKISRGEVESEHWPYLKGKSDAA